MNKAQVDKLRKFRISGIDVDQDMILPNYDGLSNFNIPEEICRQFGIAGLGNPGLEESISGKLSGDYQNIILVLVDALGAKLLDMWAGEESGLVWKNAGTNRVDSVLTSVTASTTSTALTSLWTGKAPVEHGVLGYELWLKEYGIVANMIEHKPISFAGGTGDLNKAGFSSENSLFGRSIASHYKENGIETHAFQHYSIVGSGMSASFMQDAILHPIGPTADMWVSARNMMESEKGKRKFVYLYWPAVDSLSHFHGPDDERVFEEFKSFSRAFEEIFLDKLSDGAKEKSLVILTADHGQIRTEKREELELSNHPDFLKLMTIKPTGENRLPYLFCKPGKQEKVVGYADENWPGEFLFIDSKTAVEAGLFGTGNRHLMVMDRVGDLIAIPRGNSYWWWSRGKNPLKGRHGGLSEEEMLVPFIAFEI